jgi:hypothetical protein
MLPIEILSYCFDYLYFKDISFGVCRFFDKALMYNNLWFIKKYTDMPLETIVKQESYETFMRALRFKRFFKVDLLSLALHSSIKGYTNVVKLCNQNNDIDIPFSIDPKEDYSNLYYKLAIVRRRDLCIDLAYATKDWFKFGLWSLIQGNLENLKISLTHMDSFIYYIFCLRSIDYEQMEIFKYLASKNLNHAREAAVEKACIEALEVVFTEGEFITREEFNNYYKLADKEYVKDFLTKNIIVFDENYNYPY